MSAPWKATVLSALHRYCKRHACVQIERRAFLSEELPIMVAETASVGRTPAQTVSRVLQELRDEGKVFFSQAGVYVIGGVSIDAVEEDFPEDVLEHAALSATLVLSDVATSDTTGQSRVRRGMAAVRRATLRSYRSCCALCDVNDAQLLVASHIARWADRPDARGHLANVLCLCKLHDPLFELGYLALSDDLAVMWRPSITSIAIRTWADRCTLKFQLPIVHPPSIEYLQEHRTRVGL